MKLEKNFYTESKSADWRFERENDFYVAWIMGNEVLSIEYIRENWPALTVVTTPVKDFRGKTVKRLKEIGYKESENRW